MSNMLSEHERYIYPEDAFRKWEILRQDHEESLGMMFTKQVESAIRGIEHPVILDDGCGEGYAKQLLEETLPHVTVIGIDFDPEALHEDRWLPNDEDSPRVAADLEKLPFAAESFDAIVSISGITTLESFEMLPIASELSRVLKPNGKLIVTNDTPRGSAVVQDCAIEQVFTRPNEMQVVAYDVFGEISELAIVEKDIMRSALSKVCQAWGIAEQDVNDYEKLSRSNYRLVECVMTPLFAAAAQEAGRVAPIERPHQWSSVNGSWNRYFYKLTEDNLEQYFRTCYVTDSIDVDIPPKQVQLDEMPAYATKQLRDTVGNVYFTELSANKPDTARQSVRAAFLIGTKKR